MPKAEQSVDGHMSSLVEEKLVVSAKTSSHGHNNKSWAQKASTGSATHQQSSHDSNNNVATGTSSVPQKKVVTTASVAVTAAPGRSPMASPKVRHDPLPTATEPVVVNGSSSAATKAVVVEPPAAVVQKANAILQTDVVPHQQQQQQQKKLETNTVSVTATPAAINGVGEKPQAPAPAVVTAAAAAAPSSWASLFASSQKPTGGDNANGPVVGSKKPVAKVLPFEGTQVQATIATNTAGVMSYSAASSLGLAAPNAAAQAVQSTGTVVGVQSNQPLTVEQNNNNSADRRGFKLGGECSEIE